MSFAPASATALFLSFVLLPFGAVARGTHSMAPADDEPGIKLGNLPAREASATPRTELHGPCPTEMQCRMRAQDGRAGLRDRGQCFLASSATWRGCDALPTWLWNAATCFDEAGFRGLALRALVRLIHEYPKGPLAERAMNRIVAWNRGPRPDLFYRWLGRSLLYVAERFPSEVDEVDAIGSAHGRRYYDDDDPFETLAAIEKSYRKHGPSVVASAYFLTAEIYDPDDQIRQLCEHWRHYLRRWAKYDVVDHRVRAHVRLGELLWDHDPTSRGEALVHFRAAARVWQDFGGSERISGNDTDRREAAAADANAEALFRLADATHEEALRRTALPEQNLAKMLIGYQRVVELARGPWSVAAAARMGELQARSPGLMSRAQAAFERCLQTATALDWHGEWSRLCERELHRIKPLDYPLPSEIHAEPVLGAPVDLSAAPIMSEVALTDSEVN